MKNNNDFLNFISEFSNNVLLCQDLYSLDNLLVNSIKKIDLIKKIEVFKYNILKFLTIFIKTFLNKNYFLLFDENDVLVV